MFDDCTRFGREEYNCGSTAEAKYAKPRKPPGLITTSDGHREADWVRMPGREDIVDPSKGERASDLIETVVAPYVFIGEKGRKSRYDCLVISSPRKECYAITTRVGRTWSQSYSFAEMLRGTEWWVAMPRVEV